ncbi:MAG: hypothetical protein Q9214_005057 [Letrouitia sp. 1 TL-2023]
MSTDTVQIGDSKGRNNHSFTQNGQVDWVAFGKSIWSTSSVVLQRFASAGIQPITFGGGLALGSLFDLDRVGKQRVESALDQIRGVWSFEKILWFGFGARSFLRVMADAQSGVNSIALCSALGEVYGEHGAAWILDELWKIYSFPQEFLPSHSQLSALTRSCSGLLTRTEFSFIPDQMLGHTLDPSNIQLDMSNAGDIAKAMSGLFKISKGEVARISVMGGEDCSFIAGFAQWLLNLTVFVVDEAGRVIYQNSDSEEAQVVVTYHRHADISPVQISSTTYILRQNEEMFIRQPTLQQIYFIVRTPWDGCLMRVFGNTFSALTKASMFLADFLGSTARVYRALALGESDVGKLSRKLYFNFIESSYGIGFIHSAVSIFPELKHVSGFFEQMQFMCDQPFGEAVRIIERAILDLQQLCQCRRCTPSETKKESTCILILAFLIREMVSTMSCVTKDDEILPTIRGMRVAYNRISTNWSARERTLLAFALDLGEKGLYGPEEEMLRRLDLLSYPIEILSGESNHGRYLSENNPMGLEYCTATVKQGLCYYLNCLRSLSSCAENARLVHIIPGHIQMGYRQFSSVFDPGNRSDVRLSPI